MLRAQRVARQAYIRICPFWPASLDAMLRESEMNYTKFLGQN